MEARKLIATPELIEAAENAEFAKVVFAIKGYTTKRGNVQSIICRDGHPWPAAHIGKLSNKVQNTHAQD